MLNNELNVNDEIAVSSKEGQEEDWEESSKNAIRKAVKYCEENGILSDFLKEHGTEKIVDMYYHEMMVNAALELLNEQDPDQ
jgi:hypothetical protein